ncbi:MAG TPA: MFS transporter [Pirellulales bacterium]|jgi:MFS family permease|nr:MFS transporter [Pirellulales bacterium]
MLSANQRPPPTPHTPRVAASSAIASSAIASSAIASLAAAEPSAFNAPFWLTYVANTSMMTAVSLLYRYSDFVRGLGGDELQLGLIVGAGMVGSLAMRTFQGVGIDTHGARKIWIGSAALVIACCFAHLTLTTANGPAIFLVRIATQSGIAGFFGATISFVSGRAPQMRVVEVVGTLGTSGFIGTVLGTELGDWLLGADNTPSRMFMLAGSVACVSLACGWLARDGVLRRPRRNRPPWFWLVARYHPGALMLMGVSAGFGLSIPTVYVRPFTEDLGIESIGWFFVPYMTIAFGSRLALRGLPAALGLRAMAAAGGASLAAGMLTMLVVRQGWHLLLPAVFMGVGHAIMFPTVVAGGGAAFPARYRGLGTTFMLAMFDLGGFLAYVSVGAMVVGAKHLGLPAYHTMFALVAGLLGIAAGVYIWMTRVRKV